MTARRQLALPFPHDAGLHGDRFLAAPSNEAARAWLARDRYWPDGRLALWGEAGVRQDASRCTGWAAGRGGAADSRPGAARLARSAARAGGIAVDDADRAGEPALLHLLNAMREAALPVLLAAAPLPPAGRSRLPDLASRLRSVNAVGIGPAEDGLLRALLARLLSGRQLAVAGRASGLAAVAPAARPAAIREAAARLDRAALAAGAGVTRSLAVQCLADLGVGAPPPEGEIPSTADRLPRLACRRSYNGHLIQAQHPDPARAGAGPFAKAAGYMAS